MDGVFYAALVAAILVFAWSFVRVATLTDRRPSRRADDEWYVVDASEAVLRRAGSWQEGPTIAGIPMVPRVVGMSSYSADSSATFSGGLWQAPRNPDRPIVWVLPGGSSGPGCLQDELARLKRVGAIRNYYRVVAYPGGVVDYGA
jgi:hypothetical protein